MYACYPYVRSSLDGARFNRIFLIRDGDKDKYISKIQKDIRYAIKNYRSGQETSIIRWNELI